MSRTLVTGAAGFIGVHLVEALLRHGDEVICLARPRKNPPEVFSDRRVEVVGADIRDRDTIVSAMRGVERVFHLASAVATKSLETSRSTNVDGTSILATVAAEQVNPPVFVYVSSLAASGPGDRVAREFDDCRPVSHYGRTKLEAERILHSLSHRLQISVARPPCVFGPGDRNLLALYQTVIKGWNLVLSKDSRYSYVSVEDLIPGMLKVAESGKRLRTIDDDQRQGIYFLTDSQAVTFPELAEKIALTLGSGRVRHFRIPQAVGWIAGGIGEVGLRYFGRRAFLNLDKIREGLGGSWVCDGQRAEDELGFRPASSLEDRLQSTTNFYRQANWL